jgi:hypothetical protein
MMGDMGDPWGVPESGLKASDVKSLTWRRTDLSAIKLRTHEHVLWSTPRWTRILNMVDGSRLSKNREMSRRTTTPTRLALIIDSALCRRIVAASVAEWWVLDPNCEGLSRSKWSTSDPRRRAMIFSKTLPVHSRREMGWYDLGAE